MNTPPLVRRFSTPSQARPVGPVLPLSRAPRSLRPAQAGFSLVELLTAIAIIAVLAGMTIAGVGSLRARADLATCGGNLRQIGAGILLYAGEHRGQLPGPLYASQSAAFSKSHDLTGLLEPYISYTYFYKEPGGQKMVALFECPAWKKASGGDVKYDIYYGNSPIEMPGGEKLRPFGYPESSAPLRLVQIPNPSTTYALVDLDYGIKAAAYALPAPAHGTMRNYLYLDGRVGATSVK